MNLFAPLSIELSNNKIAINKNIASAASISVAGMGTIAQALRDQTKKECLETVVGMQKEFCFNARVYSRNSTATLVIYLLGKDFTGLDVYKINLNIKDINGVPLVIDPVPALTEWDVTEDQNLPATFAGANPEIKYDGFEFKTDISGFDSTKKYDFEITIGKFLVSVLKQAFQLSIPVVGALLWATETGATQKGELSVVTIKNVDISGDAKQIMSPVVSASNEDMSSIMPACNILGAGNGTFIGCVAQTIYYVLFQSTSYLFALAGTLFDNAFAFSVDDASYRSPFVVEGWKVVRDFCNMFFIFILLYIAFGTILNLNGVKTKEMIINVVLIGIFINFSLFASQVIIDASNILARVFYNSNTITINVTDSAAGATVIPLSEALVNKINPQEIILSASKINTTKDTRGKAGASDAVSTTSGISPGTFILVTILATLVNLVGIFVFLSIAFIFIARVIGLWLAMIFVPFAFLSYTVPAMQNFDMVGWKKWWPETLKLAFLAPVFIFFLYLILQFLETGFALTQTEQQSTGLSFIIGIILPFAFIMILLLKAKSVATDMSGKIGETITKAASAVGGVALGAATGGAAFLARGTVGRLGSSIMNNDNLRVAADKKGLAGFGARALRNVGGVASKGSFDARATKFAGLAGKTTGMKFGEAKGKGGFEQKKADQLAKAQKKAKEHEVSENSPLMHDLHGKEEASKLLNNENSLDLTALKGKIDAKDKDTDIKNKRAMGLEKVAETDPTEENKKAAKDARAEATVANEELKKLRDDFTQIKTGGYDEKNKKYRTSNGNINKDKADLVDDDVVANAVAQASDDLTKATDADKVTSDAINYVDSGAAKTDATTDRKTAEDAANVAEQDAKDNAAADKKTARDAANAAEIAAISKAAADKASAIEAAQARVTAATAAAAAAEMAHSLSPNEDNKKALEAANIERANANKNLGNVTTDAPSKETAAVTKAAVDKKTAEDAAAEAEKAATTKAAVDKGAAHTAAAEAESDAIKAASDAVNTAIKNANNAKAKATASGEAAAEKIRDLAAKKEVLSDPKKEFGRSINNLDLEDIPAATNNINQSNNLRRINAAKRSRSKTNKVTNFILSGGQYSAKTANQAAHDVIMNIKSEGAK